MQFQFTVLASALLAGYASMASAAALLKRDNWGGVNLYHNPVEGQAPDDSVSAQCGACMPLPTGFSQVGFGYITDPSCTSKFPFPSASCNLEGEGEKQKLTNLSRSHCL